LDESEEEFSEEEFFSTKHEWAILHDVRDALLSDPEMSKSGQVELVDGDGEREPVSNKDGSRFTDIIEHVFEFPG
jgi:hypothetical protein